MGLRAFVQVYLSEHSKPYPVRVSAKVLTLPIFDMGVENKKYQKCSPYP